MKRHTAVHVLLFVFAMALHVWAVMILSRSTQKANQVPELAEPLVTIFVKPRIRESDHRTVDPGAASLVLQLDHKPVQLQIEPLDIDFSVERNGAARNAAPSLQGDGQSGIEPYAKEAGLSSGQGATVVLRVEVLKTGDPGRVVVEVSGGSQQIDTAAIDYARTQRWYAGRIDGVPRVIWIRWAVQMRG